MNNVYAGVGSRCTPIEVGRQMQDYATRLAALGYTMVSGGARKKRDAPDNVCSADHVFEWAVAKAKGKMIIYRAYVNKFTPCGPADVRVPSEEQFNVAKAFIKAHAIIPWFDKMSSWAQLLHLRNYYQIHYDVGKKVDFVIAYAPLDDKGEPVGGTRTAIKIAEKTGVKCYNLARPLDVAMLEDFLNELEGHHG